MSLSLSSDIDDFLSEEVKGPGSFECESGKGCSFREPAMNQLINDVFGDKAITLDCESGECLHYTQVPGYKRPEKPDNSTLVALSAAIAAAIFVIACLGMSASIQTYKMLTLSGLVSRQDTPTSGWSRRSQAAGR